jgi:hypothetical protein
MGMSIQKTLTVTNDVYTIGDVVGGLITYTGISTWIQARSEASSLFVSSLKLAGVAAIAYDLWFLNADIATTAIDNAAFTLVAADEPKILGCIAIATTDYKKGPAAFNIATVNCKGPDMYLASANLYAYLVATAVTSPGTTTIYLTVDFEPM